MFPEKDFPAPKIGGSHGVTEEDSSLMGNDSASMGRNRRFGGSCYLHFQG